MYEDYLIVWLYAEESTILFLRFLNMKTSLSLSVQSDSLSARKNDE